MKKYIKLQGSVLVIVLMLALLPIKVFGANCGICPSGTSCCETIGQCMYNCPKRVHPMGEAGKLYVLPEGTLVTCQDKSLEIQKLHEIFDNLPSPLWQCPSLVGIQQGSFSKAPHFKAEPGIIYSFPAGAAFVCAFTNEPPQKVTVKNPAVGFPNVYWTCPVAHPSPSSDHNGSFSEK